jgi:tyrosyl-tRNA synthetase
MAINFSEKKIDELLTRGVNEVIDCAGLKKRLLDGEKLRVKFGIDPTSPDIHLGNAVALLKLKDFQELGHQIVFIIGDFTGQIGDTSDKKSERPMLGEKEIKNNMKTYLKQAGKILNVKKTEINYNSKWLKKLGYVEIGKQADQFSLAEFINRENIKRRLAAGKRVSLRELLYPLMQGYDSAAVKADLEIGGTDQRFNLLAGRTLQSYYKQAPQDILMTNLILGTDNRKMSKSFGNTINIFDEPSDIFGKIMSLPDNLMISYFEHCTRIPMKQVKKYAEEFKSGSGNPRDIKMELAFQIVKIYWGEKNAVSARNRFVAVFQKKEIPAQIQKINLGNKNIIDALVLSKLAKSKSDARRLINQRSIKIDGKIIESIDEKIISGNVIQKGKRHFVKIV